ncbi:MAG: cytochrome c3 family protein [Pyrinomonadaceae bacterium]
MRKVLPLILVMFLMAAGFLIVDTLSPKAQRLPKPAEEKKKVIPEVIILGKEAKLGKVTFNHVKHNGGEYNIGGPILCIECHHTAQPASDLDKIPPHKTVWPIGRTTALTAELFAADPIKAGVAACRDCHARSGRKPKLLEAIPSIADPETKQVTMVTNQLAFHSACDVCHFEIQFRTTGSKVPSATNCATCHKSAAKKH